MLAELVTEHARELRELQHSRPRYDRAESHSRSRLREAVRRLALTPATASAGASGRFPEVVLRSAAATDGRALARLAEASERRLPSGLVLVAEVDATVVAALPVGEGFVLADLTRPTGDLVQLLELRAEQLRAGNLALVA